MKTAKKQGKKAQATPSPTTVAPVFLELTYRNPHGDDYPMLFNVSVIHQARANGTTPEEGTVLIFENESKVVVAESYEKVKQMLEAL